MPFPHMTVVWVSHQEPGLPGLRGGKQWVWAHGGADPEPFQNHLEGECCRRLGGGHSASWCILKKEMTRLTGPRGDRQGCE